MENGRPLALPKEHSNSNSLSSGALPGATLSMHDDTNSSVSEVLTNPLGKPSGRNRSSSTSNSESRERVTWCQKFIPFLLVGFAILVAVGAAVTTGLLIQSFAKRELLSSAQNLGQQTIAGAAAQLELLTTRMHYVLEDLRSFSATLPAGTNLADWNETTAAITREFMKQWATRMNNSNYVQGVIVGFVYPIPSVVPIPNSQIGSHTDCFLSCRAPGVAPHFDALSTVGLYREPLSGYNGEALMSITSKTPTMASLHVVDFPTKYNATTGDHFYTYQGTSNTRNATTMEDHWIAPHYWTSRAGLSSFHIGLVTMYYVDGKYPVLLRVVEQLAKWHSILNNLISTNNKKHLFLVDSIGRRIMATSKDRVGDARLGNCTFGTKPGILDCNSITAKNHPNAFTSKLFTDLDDYIFSVKEKHNHIVDEQHLDDDYEWLSFKDEKYMVLRDIVIEVKGSFDIIAVWCVPESEIFSDFRHTTMTTVVLCTLMVVVSSLVLGVNTIILVRRANSAKVVGAKVARSIATYDLGQAEAILEASTGLGELHEEFERIVQNLMIYRHFLPTSLQEQQAMGTFSDITSTNHHNHHHREVGNKRQSKDNDDAAIIDVAGAVGIDEDPTELELDPQQLNSAEALPAFRADKLGDLYKFKTIRFSCVRVLIHNLAASSSMSASVSKSIVPKILTASRRFSGVAEELKPDSIYITFGAHSTVVQHEEQAAHFALAVASNIASAAAKKHIDVTISVASGNGFVGTCGDAMQKAHVTGGEVRDIVTKMGGWQRTIGVSVAATDKVAHAATLPMMPVDIVEPKWMQAGRSNTVHLYDLSIATSSENNNSAAMLEAARSAFLKMKTGDFEAAKTILLKMKEDQSSAPTKRFSSQTEAQVDRLIAVCNSCIDEHCTTGLRRRELYAEAFKDEPVFQKSLLLRLHAEDHATATTVAHEEGMQRLKEQFSPTTLAPDDGLLSMFLPADEETKGSEELPRDVVDTDKVVWTRMDGQLGRGTFSKVFKVLNSRTGKLCAMKSMALKQKNTNLSQLLTEIDALKNLRHPNVVSYVSCAVLPTHLAIFMELLSTDTLHDIISLGPMHPQFVSRMTIEVAGGLHYIHSEGYVHCDLKPQNVLLSDDSTCKVADLGSAIIARTKPSEIASSTGDTNFQKKRKVSLSGRTLRGTALYMAPESIIHDEYTSASDVWALGVLIMEALVGCNPWCSTHSTAQAFVHDLGTNPRMVPNIVELKGIREHRLGSVSSPVASPLTTTDRNDTLRTAAVEANLWSVAEGCCRRDPRDRISIMEAINRLS